MKTFPNLWFPGTGIVILLFLGSVTIAFATDGGKASSYEVTLYGHEIRESSDSSSEIALDIEFRNTVDPMLVFDYDMDEALLFSDVSKNAFLVIDGEWLSTMRVTKEPGFVPDRFVLKNESSRMRGSMVFPCPVKEPKSIVFYYYHDRWGKLSIPVLGEVAAGKKLQASAISANDRVQLFVGDHGDWDARQGVSAALGHQFYYVDLWGRSLWKREVPAYYIDPEADPKAMSELDYPFMYHQAETVLNLLVEGQYSVLFRPDLSTCNNPLLFISDQWSRVRLVYEIPEKVGKLDLDAQFVKTGLSDEGAEYLDSIDIPLFKKEAIAFPTAKAVTVQDIDGDNRLEVEIALVPDVSSWGVTANQYIGLACTFRNVGKEPGMVAAMHRFWFSGGKEIRPSVVEENSYQPPENLYLALNQSRSFLLLCKKADFEELGNPELNYSGIGQHIVFETDLQNGTLTPLSSTIDPVVQQPNPKASPDTAQPTPSQPAKIRYESPNATESTSESDQEVPYEYVIPFVVEEPEPYHVEAFAQSQKDLAEMKEEPFDVVEQYSYEEFEDVNGKVSTLEAEENNDFTTANHLEIGQVARGSIEEKGNDYWVFSVKQESRPNERFSISFAVDSNEESIKGAYLYLYNAQKQQLTRVWAESVFEEQNFGFEEGDYYLRIGNDGNQPAADYLFKIKKTSTKGLVEREENDRKEDATPLALGDQIEGIIDSSDKTDYYRIEFTEEDSRRRWEGLLQFDQPEAGFIFRLIQDDGESVYWGNGKGSSIMGDLSPVPGVYTVQVECSTKTPVHYRLKFIDRGAKRTGWEFEPNDNLKSNTIPIIETIDGEGPELLGRFEGRYGDFFAVNIKDTDRMYTLTLGGDVGRQISAYNLHRGELRRVYASMEMRASLVDMRLPLGLNYFLVEGDSGDYSINVQSTAIPSDTYEWEPNDNENHAQLMQMGREFSGRLLDTHDDDYFRIVVHQAMNYRFDLKSGKGGVSQLRLRGHGFKDRHWQTDPESLSLSEVVYLLPGNYIIQLEARQPNLGIYGFEVTPVNPFESREEDGPVSIEAKNSDFVVAAFADDYQSVEQKLVVSNHGSSDLKVELEAVASHHSIQPDEASLGELSLPAGASRDLSIRWLIDPQVWGDDLISLYVGVKLPGGTAVSAESQLMLSNSVIPVGVVRDKYALDDAIAGGFNLNLLDLGAEAAIPDAADYPDEKLPNLQSIKYLIDGALARYSFFGFQAISRLVGDGNVPIVGTTIDLYGRGSLWESAKAFAIDLSDDGKQFREVYTGELEPVTGTQSFLFDQPRKAKYARIRVLGTQGENIRYPHLGEWRMIAKPSVPLPGQEDINLLKKEFGGHKIYEGEHFRVYGFQHGRAARLGKIRWKNRTASKNTYRNIPFITVEASLDSPVGPWKKIADFDLSEADAETLETLQSFTDEPWARFIKVSWPAPEEGVRYQNEESFDLFEKQVSADYRSVMGEWGDPTAKGYYEYMQREEATELTELKRIASSREAPYRLEPETWIDSVAWVKEHWEDWYEIDPVSVPKKLQFSVSGSPFVKVAVELFDDKGKPVDVQEAHSTSTQKNYLFRAEPNQRYLVHVYEPKRSIVYLWDVSGSMGAFVPSIENAVLKFSQEIDPVQEKIQLLPFAEPPKFLLDHWESDSYVLQNTVRNYDPPSSSYAHLNLKAATEMLRDEEGTRAAIVITDCESPRGVNQELWEALLDVKPSVFTFQTSDQPNSWGIQQDDMQDWAAVGGGFYYNTREVYELDTAFERVQAYLRRPAPYRIRLTAPVLLPSYIEVVNGRDQSTLKDPSKDGVLLIIDASASMRDKLPDGQMKVSAAKRVIQDLVDHYLPKAIQFGLRVFGHRGSENCASELVIPVATLDPDLVKEKLMFIRSSSLANTALAEALAWVKEDFKEIEGNKRVVVLTDGEETCHGDPPSIIADLASEGFQVTVNIVGFTLVEERVKNEYSNWIKSTGGTYYDAQDVDALGDALKKATTPVELPKFQIFDTKGNLIASGIVGDAPLKVDAGKYLVKILDGENPKEQQIDVFEKTATLKYE